MKTPKRTLPLLGCLSLAVLFLAGNSRILRPHTSPLDRALAITQTASWHAEAGNPYGFPLYYWSGANDLTYASTGRDGKEHLFQRPASAHPGTTDIEGPVIQLRGGYPGALSPDGKWFVEWHQNKQQQRIPTFVAMDGTQRRDGEPTGGTEGIWTPKSDSMVSGVGRKTAAIDRYIPKSGIRQQVTLPGLNHFYTPQRIDSSGRLICMENGNFIMHIAQSTRLPSINYPNIKVVRVDLSHPDSKPEQWSVPVPREIDNGTCVFSPAGDRILWEVHGDTTPTLIQRIRRHIPGLAASSGNSYRWLVSGIHGEDMHEIASYQILARQTQGYVRAPYSRPRWMPDGKHISFIYRDTLYTRPIE